MIRLRGEEAYPLLQEIPTETRLADLYLSTNLCASQQREVYRRKVSMRAASAAGCCFRLG